MKRYTLLNTFDENIMWMHNLFRKIGERQARRGQLSVAEQIRQLDCNDLGVGRAVRIDNVCLVDAEPRCNVHELIKTACKSVVYVNLSEFDGVGNARLSSMNRDFALCGIFNFYHEKILSNRWLARCYLSKIRNAKQSAKDV